SGVIMSVRQLYNLGDLVETNGHFGNIQSISLRSTIIKGKDGKEIVIPNKDVLQTPLINHTVGGERRVDVSCGVSYGDDLEQVQALVIQTISALAVRKVSSPVDCFFTDYGDSSINFTTRFWIEETEQKSYLMARSEAIIAIKKAFDAHDIAIPFPIRTMDFGVKGGVNIQEAVPFQVFKTNGVSVQ
ncbi:MAG: mechanosensitive ion channel domain-containing protein, partial [Bacteroidota bacterium]